MWLHALPALVPTSGGCARLSLGRALQALCGANKDFYRLVYIAFYGQNSFKIEDTNMRHQFGTHRWLELADKVDILKWIRSLEINVNIEKKGQTKHHLRRIGWHVLTMSALVRLVVLPDMHCFIHADEGYKNPDVDFIYDNAAYDHEHWPMLRMLIWARKELKVYIPGVRIMEASFRELKELDDADIRKFWVPSDWQKPPEGFPSVKVATAIASVVNKQSPNQRLNLVESAKAFEKYGDGPVPEGECGSDENPTEIFGRDIHGLLMTVDEVNDGYPDMADSGAELDLGLDEDESMDENAEADASVDDD